MAGSRPRKIFSECFRVLKKKGKLFIITPNKWNSSVIIFSFLFRVTPEALRHKSIFLTENFIPRSKSTIRHQLKKIGFQDFSIKNLFFVPEVFNFNPSVIDKFFEILPIVKSFSERIFICASK